MTSRKVIYYDRWDLSSGMQEWFNIKKLINVINYIKRTNVIKNDHLSVELPLWLSGGNHLQCWDLG